MAIYTGAPEYREHWVKTMAQSVPIRAWEGLQEFIAAGFVSQEEAYSLWKEIRDSWRKRMGLPPDGWGASGADC